MNFKLRTILSRTFILILFCSGGMLSAQVFQKVGTGINTAQNSTLYGSCSWSDVSGLYFGYNLYKHNPYSAESRVAKWDGLKWTYFPPVPARSIRSVAVYQGDVYAAAGSGSQGNLFKFDGTLWQPVLSNFSGEITDMIIHNNNLVLAGSFTEGTTGNHGIVGFDGTQPVALPSLRVVDSVADVNIINNELWVAGILHNYYRGDTAEVKKLSNGQWISPAVAHKGGSRSSRLRGVFGYNSKVYIFDNSSIWEVGNDTASYIDNVHANSYTEHGGKMYLAASNLRLFDGTTAVTIANAPNSVSQVVAHNNMLFGLFRDTVYNGDKTYQHVFKSNSQFGLLSGRTFIDKNSNCTWDPGTDQSAGMRLIALGSAPASIVSYRDGLYQVALAPGTYNFSNITNYTRINRYLVPACNNASSISIQANQNYTEDFVVQHDGTVDVETSFHPLIRHRARQGFTEGYTVVVKNPGAAISNSFDLKVTVPSSISLVSMNPSTLNISGSTYTFSISGIGEREEKRFFFRFKIDRPTNAVNDTLTFYTDIVGISNDAFPANDKDTLKQRVVAACDPNDKTPNVERSLPGLNQLDYHIRFQNTGTDTAYKVVIVDTLESYLDAASMMINDVSHDYSFELIDEHILVFTFDNILLPDSGANQMGSRGYVDFTINVDPNLSVGDTIDNDAEIYFDFQPPVHTNHAKTAIVQWVGEEELKVRKEYLQVYPNPASSVLNLKNTSGQAQQLQLYDVQGRLLDHLEVARDEVTRYTIDALPAGIYFLQSDFGLMRVIIRE